MYTMVNMYKGVGHILYGGEDKLYKKESLSCSAGPSLLFC